VSQLNRGQKYRLHISGMFLFFILQKEIIAIKVFENRLSHMSGPTVSDANVAPTSELYTFAMLVLLILENYNVQRYLVMYIDEV
jgi:hypothetical protein